MTVYVGSRRYERDSVKVVNTSARTRPGSSLGTSVKVSKKPSDPACFVTYLFLFTAKGHAHEGMYSDLKPLFDQIDAYYEEVNVSLRAEEHRLKTIRSSLRVTPDDRLRWEYIRNACHEASRLLASQVDHLSYAPTDLTSCNQSPQSPPHTSQPVVSALSIRLS